jgi:simple sugar transport system permease protein
MSDILQVSFIISLLSGMFRMAVPIMFAALGEMITERSGVLNLGVEGTMLVGGFAAFLATYQTGSLWIGLIWAVIAGSLMSSLLAFIVVILKADQTIAGLTINIFAAGISLYLFRVTFEGVATENLPTVETFEQVAIPLLSQIPYLGEFLFNQHLLTYLVLILGVLVHVFLFHTKYGLVLRSIGDNPRAVDMKGVNVTRYQFLGVIFGGMMAGLGGSFLTLASAGLYSPGMVAGRGWIALAIVILGNWKPINIVFSALMFGFLDTFQLQVQGIGVDFPYQILLAMPYVLTIVVLVFGRYRSGEPIALGKPYLREG